jgi:hypothetical protein
MLYDAVVAVVVAATVTAALLLAMLHILRCRSLRAVSGEKLNASAMLSLNNIMFAFNSNRCALARESPTCSTTFTQSHV